MSKPRKAIHIYETGHGFRLNDRKLFNCLLYYAEVSKAWEQDASAGPIVFVASTQDLRRDIGFHQKASNSQLRESLERLHQQDVVFPLVRDDTSGIAMAGRLIEDFHLAKGQSSLQWSFPAELVPQLVRDQWAYLDIQVCAKFRSKYSLILYEMMSTLVRREHKLDSWPVDELRNWLGVDRPDHPKLAAVEIPEKLQGWNPFYKRALKPALEEVNRLASFTVTIKPKTGYCGRRVEKVHFIVEPKSGGQ